MAQVHAAKVKSQNYAAGAPQTTGDPVDDFVVHRAAVERVGMAYEARLYRVPIFRLFEQRFQAACRPIDKVRFDSTRHVSSTGNS